MTRPPVTLQINLAPSDYRHARHLLPHQLAAWRGQVDEILLTIDFHRSAGRFSDRWEEGKSLIGALAAEQPGARVVEVDYRPAARQRVAADFFGGRPVPQKDFRGGPYYAYFFGLNAAAHDRVLHTDSDIFFGGGSRTWIAEAEQLFAARPEVVFAAPHPGPPAPDGILRSQDARPDSALPAAFRFDGMSTRIFYYSRSRVRELIGPLDPLPPPRWRDRIKARVESNPSADLPEHLWSGRMRRRSLTRVEFLGSAPGKWTLHPPYRSADFYSRLPELIRRIEAGELPPGQRGDHDLNATLVDWAEGVEALRTNRWWRRLRDRFR
jgi:hypothetical protein